MRTKPPLAHQACPCAGAVVPRRAMVSRSAVAPRCTLPAGARRGHDDRPVAHPAALRGR